MRIVYTVYLSLLRTYVLGFDACLVSSSISKTGLSTKLIATVCVTLPADAIEVPKSIDGLLVRALRFARYAAYSPCPERENYNSYRASPWGSIRSNAA